LIGAGAIHWGGYDHKISDWANKGTTVYNDQSASDNWSDNFNNILKYEMYATILLTPSMDENESLKNYAFLRMAAFLFITVS
jgi:hypothetical protein